MMMTFYNIIIVIILGLFGGILNGVTGLSGIGIILMVLSFTNIINDYKTTIGTVLYILMFPTSIFGVIEYSKNYKIDFGIGNILIITLLIGAYIGAKLSILYKYNLPDKTVKYISAFIALFTGFYFLISAYHTK